MGQGQLNKHAGREEWQTTNLSGGSRLMPNAQRTEARESYMRQAVERVSMAGLMQARWINSQRVLHTLRYRAG
jgi:hypothetical protein